MMDKKVVGRPWQPGRSGNPGGRPKAALDIQALAREHTPDAIPPSLPHSPIHGSASAQPWHCSIADGESRSRRSRARWSEPTSCAHHAPVESVDEWLRLHAPSDSRTDPAIDGKLSE